MAGETIQGVDSSYDQLTVVKAQCLKAKGIELFMQALTALPRTGLHRPSHRITNLVNAYHSNLATAGYLLIAPGLTGKQCVAEARRGIPMDVWKRLKFVAIDAEVNGIFDWQILDACREVERLEKRAVIYTSYNVWTTMVKPRNSKLLSTHGFGLLNASWDNKPDINFSRLPFGNWTDASVIGEQWSGGTVICGQSVDQDTFYKYVLDVTVPTELPVTPPPVINKPLLELTLAFTNGSGLGPAWWLITRPFSWKMHIVNLKYMEYMQKRRDWPSKVEVLTPNEAELLKGLPHLGPIPSFINQSF